MIKIITVSFFCLNLIYALECAGADYTAPQDTLDVSKTPTSQDSVMEVNQLILYFSGYIYLKAGKACPHHH